MIVLWGIAEIAEHFGVTKQAVNGWTTSSRFPKPAYRLAAGRFWRARDVKAWARRYRKG